MANYTHADKNLAEAFRIGLRDFGARILSEERLMGVLKDYQGFRSFPQGEFIVRTLIADGAFSRINKIVTNGQDNSQDFIHRETDRIARKFGFSYSLIKSVLDSFLIGMGINVNSKDSRDCNVRPIESSISKSNISLKKTYTDNSKKSTQNKNKHGGNAKPTTPHRNTANRSVRQGSNNPNPNNNKNGHTGNYMDLFLVVGVGILLIILGTVLLIKGCERNESDYQEENPFIVVIDSVDYVVYDTLHTIELEASERDSKEPEENNASSTSYNAEQKAESKKKSIDPRFQYPDGRYKQPSEYMKYFNEDYDDEDEYEDGYEDGYDDAEEE